MMRQLLLRSSLHATAWCRSQSPRRRAYQEMHVYIVSLEMLGPLRMGRTRRGSWPQVHRATIHSHRS